eukprot:6565605-Alexandrium_andersonii.AAC.1
MEVKRRQPRPYSMHLLAMLAFSLRARAALCSVVHAPAGPARVAGWLGPAPDGNGASVPTSVIGPGPVTQMKDFSGLRMLF